MVLLKICINSFQKCPPDWSWGILFQIPQRKDKLYGVRNLLSCDDTKQKKKAASLPQSRTGSSQKEDSIHYYTDKWEAV